MDRRLREAAKKVFFCGLAIPSSLVATFIFGFFFVELQKCNFFLVTGPLQKKTFFAASLSHCNFHVSYIWWMFFEARRKKNVATKIEGGGDGLSEASITSHLFLQREAAKKVFFCGRANKRGGGH